MLRKILFNLSYDVIKKVHPLEARLCVNAPLGICMGLVPIRL